MEIIIEKLNKSELFPENIKNFLIESIKKGEISTEMIEELKQMLEEEELAISKIDNK